MQKLKTEMLKAEIKVWLALGLILSAFQLFSFSAFGAVGGGIYIPNSSGSGSGANIINVRNIKNSDGAVGNGSTDDRAAILAADTAVSATNGTVYLPPGTYRIASNLTTTNTFWFSSGAKVSVDSGATWWHRGKLIASPEQHIFDGAGTVSFQTNYQIGTIWVDWFGANQGVTTINEATNSAGAIQRALNAARIKVSEYYALTEQQPNGVWQNTWAHYPGYRQVAFRPGGFYLLTTNLVMQESYFSDIQGNHATLYALFPFTTNAVWECNDVRMGLFENLVIKTYRESNAFAGFRFNNIATVETGVTPFNSTFRKVQVLGHLKGFQFGWFIGDGTDANNERFTFDTCVAMDYERSGWLFKGSQAFDHVLFNCTASGGGYGWFGVSCFDPTWAPSGSGSYHLFSGGGGANIISDFVANSFRPTSVYGWDSESSRRLYVDPFFPVPTNTFSFDTGGTNFYGTNTLVAGFVNGNTNWVTTTYTNDFSAHANKDVWEYLVSTGGVHRIAVTAGTRPYNPSFPLDGVTSFNIVRCGPSGITNYDKTWGAVGSSANGRTQKITINGFNFSSDIMPWDGTGVLMASPKPTEFIGRWRSITNHVKFGLFTSTASGDDGSINFQGSTFNVQDAATSPPSDAERVLLFRSDGTLDTNNVNGNFVSITAGNNIHASVPENVTSNLLGNTFQRSVYELAGTGSKLIVGGTVISNAVATFTGSVGIGTNAPTDTLHVHGTVRGVTGFTSDGANDTLMPTNTPTDGYALTAAGTAGYTKWAAVSGGSGNGAWRTNALAGVSQPNLSPYDPATAVVVIPQDLQVLASNGVSSRIFYPNGNAFAEFPLDGGFELNEPGGQTAIKVASSAAGGYSLLNTNNTEALGWEDGAGLRIPSGTVQTLHVGSLKFATNAGAINPDFNKPYQKFGTNDNFVFLAPSNVELTYKTNVQSCVVLVTNVAKGSLMTVTPPANCWPQGNWFVTNNGVTTFTFFTYAGQWTNCVALPLF